MQLYTSALQGIERGVRGIRQSASTIARLQGADGTKNLSRSMVEMHQHKTTAISSAKALTVANEVIGSLLDVRA